MKRKTRHAMLLAMMALVAVIIVGCATRRDMPIANLHPYAIADVGRLAAAPSHAPDRPIVALVLGGGGLRGFAHIGVLRALEERGIHPDLIVGTSAGAVVGAAYASGLTPEQIESMAFDTELSSLIDFSFSRQGLIRGDNLAAGVDDLSGGIPIERFPRKFAAVATDLERGEAVLLTSGNAGSVVRASSAVPGMNMPVPYRNGHLVDGGVTSLVPVRFARALGADVVIAVDIYCGSDRSPATNAPAVIGRVMQLQSCQLAAPALAEADILISPRVAVPALSDRQQQWRVIRAGYETARMALRDHFPAH